MPRPDDVLEITYAELQATLRKARRQAYRKGEATAVSFLKSVAKLNGSAAPLLKAAGAGQNPGQEPDVRRTSGASGFVDDSTEVFSGKPLPQAADRTSGENPVPSAGQNAGQDSSGADEYGPLYEALLAAVIEARESGDDDAVPGLVEAYREHLDGGGAELHKATWDTNKHPRDDQGRFVSRDSIADAKGDPAKEEALRDRVTDPEEREKLDNALAGTTDLGRTKRGQAKHEAGQRRAKKAANHAAASEIADRIAAGTATHEDMHDLGDHLEGLTLDKLRQLQSRIPTDVRGRRKADVVSALKESLERSAHMKRVGEGAAGVAGRAAADPARLALAGMLPNRYDVTTADGEVVPAGKGYQRWEGGGKAVGYTAEQAAKVAAGVTADHADRRIQEHERAATAPDIDDVQREYHATIADQLRGHKETVFGGGEKPALETETTPPASTGVGESKAEPVDFEKWGRTVKRHADKLRDLAAKGDAAAIADYAENELGSYEGDVRDAFNLSDIRQPDEADMRALATGTMRPDDEPFVSKLPLQGVSMGSTPAAPRRSVAEGRHTIPARQYVFETPDQETDAAARFASGKTLYEYRADVHRAAVEAALAAGKPVPPEVLADYPDLAPPPSAPGPGETPDAARQGGAGEPEKPGVRRTVTIGGKSHDLHFNADGTNHIEDDGTTRTVTYTHNGVKSGSITRGGKTEYFGIREQAKPVEPEPAPEPTAAQMDAKDRAEFAAKHEKRVRAEMKKVFRDQPAITYKEGRRIAESNVARTYSPKPADPATAHAATLPARGKPPAWVSSDPQHAAAADHYGRATGAAKTVLETALDNAGYLRRDPKTDAVTGFEKAAPDDEFAHHRYAAGLAAGHRQMLDNGMGTPAEVAHVEAALEAAGAERVDAADGGFDGSVHEAYPGVFTGHAVKVTKPGWVVRRPDGGADVVKAQVEPAGAGKGDTNEQALARQFDARLRDELRAAGHGDVQVVHDPKGSKLAPGSPPAAVELRDRLLNDYAKAYHEAGGLRATPERLAARLATVGKEQPASPPAASQPDDLAGLLTETEPAKRLAQAGAVLGRAKYHGGLTTRQEAALKAEHERLYDAAHSQPPAPSSSAPAKPAAPAVAAADRPELADWLDAEWSKIPKNQRRKLDPDEWNAAKTAEYNATAPDLAAGAANVGGRPANTPAPTPEAKPVPATPAKPARTHSGAEIAAAFEAGATTRAADANPLIRAAAALPKAEAADALRAMGFVPVGDPRRQLAQAIYERAEATSRRNLVGRGPAAEAKLAREVGDEPLLEPGTLFGPAAPKAVAAKPAAPPPKAPAAEPPATDAGRALAGLLGRAGSADPAEIDAAGSALAALPADELRRVGGTMGFRYPAGHSAKRIAADLHDRMRKIAGASVRRKLIGQSGQGDPV